MTYFELYHDSSLETGWRMEVGRWRFEVEGMIEINDRSEDTVASVSLVWLISQLQPDSLAPWLGKSV